MDTKEKQANRSHDSKEEQSSVCQKRTGELPYGEQSRLGKMRETSKASSGTGHHVSSRAGLVSHDNETKSLLSNVTSAATTTDERSARLSKE